MSRKLVERRGQSNPAIHRPDYLFGCPGRLKTHLDRGLVWTACERCGRVMGKWAVIPTPPEPQLDTGWRDEESDVDDPEAYGV